jgi:hypothetical protein
MAKAKVGKIEAAVGRDHRRTKDSFPELLTDPALS